MSERVATLLAEALKLSDEERGELADALLDSLDGPPSDYDAQCLALTPVRLAPQTTVHPVPISLATTAGEPPGSGTTRSLPPVLVPAPTKRVRLF